MNTIKKFLIKFRYLEGELREHLEFSKLNDNEEVRKLLIKYLKEVRKMQAIIRDEIARLT